MFWLVKTIYRLLEIEVMSPFYDLLNPDFLSVKVKTLQAIAPPNSQHTFT